MDAIWVVGMVVMLALFLAAFIVGIELGWRRSRKQ